MTCGMEAMYVLNKAAVGLADVSGQPVPVGGEAWVDPHRDPVIEALAAGTIEQKPRPRHVADVAGPPISGEDALVARRQAEWPPAQGGYEG